MLIGDWFVYRIPHVVMGRQGVYMSGMVGICLLTSCHVLGRISGLYQNIFYFTLICNCHAHCNKPNLCNYLIMFHRILYKKDRRSKSDEYSWLHRCLKTWASTTTFIRVRTDLEYCTRDIITHGFDIFYPIFKVHSFVFKEFFSENSILMQGRASEAPPCLMYGSYLRAVCNQERVMMARVW